jgi:riboflavin kinase / FMN adenylyltransferase
MRTFDHLQPGTLPGPTFLTIGNFDGVHLGHQALLLRTRAQAADAGGTSAILTFSPHPFTVLRPGSSILQLTTPTERLMLAASLGIDVGVIEPFTVATAQMDAAAFVAQLQQALGLAGLVVGPDFALGRNRSGNLATLRILGEVLGFVVEVVEPVEWRQIPARSSTIRDALQRGDVATASGLLGRAYSVTGPVQKGDQRGRQIGIPTANVAYAPDKLLPANGVYATVTRLCTAHWAYAFPSVTNIGVRPTVDGLHHRVEAHLLNFPPPELPDDLYGEILTVEFVERLRGEQKFAGLNELVAQIQLDIAQARAILDS